MTVEEFKSTKWHIGQRVYFFSIKGLIEEFKVVRLCYTVTEDMKYVNFVSISPKNGKRITNISSLAGYYLLFTNKRKAYKWFDELIPV